MTARVEAMPYLNFISLTAGNAPQVIDLNDRPDRTRIVETMFHAIHESQDVGQ
jgi:hypothetical protein